MRYIQTVPLINQLMTFYRHCWNVYQLEERSQAVVVDVVNTMESGRAAVSVIFYQRGAQDHLQKAQDIFKSQLNQAEDEFILIRNQDESPQVGKKINAAIQSAKNSLLVVASSNMLPRENWLKWLTYYQGE